MKNKPLVKIKYGEGSAKKIILPDSFAELVGKVRDQIKIKPTQKYQIIEEKANREIKGEEDYQLMSKEFQNEKIIRVKVKVLENNIIDQNKYNENIESNFEFIQNNKIEEKKKDIDEDNNEMNDKIKMIIHNKMKETKEKMVDDLYKSIMNYSSLSNIDNKYRMVIHKGIKCNKCGIDEIKGIRYKCCTCSNYNLCEFCEGTTNHDDSHIFLKIKKPIEDEKEIETKIDKSLKYMI